LGSRGQASARGGDESKFQTEKNFDAWLRSCSTLKVPLIQHSDVAPMTDVIDDSAKKANMRKAIIEYGNGRL